MEGDCNSSEAERGSRLRMIERANEGASRPMFHAALFSPGPLIQVKSILAFLDAPSARARTYKELPFMVWYLKASRRCRGHCRGFNRAPVFSDRLCRLFLFYSREYTSHVRC